MDSKVSAPADAMESSDYKQKYKLLKRKLKGLVYVSLPNLYSFSLCTFWMRYDALVKALLDDLLNC